MISGQGVPLLEVVCQRLCHVLLGCRWVIVDAVEAYPSLQILAPAKVVCRLTPPSGISHPRLRERLARHLATGSPHPLTSILAGLNWMERGTLFLLGTEKDS